MDESLHDLLSVAEAIALIDALPVHPRQIELPLMRAIGLRLAADLLADRDYPPFDKALMDGYAVRCADLASVPADLRIVGQAAAGHSVSQAIGPMQAMTIMTGAPVPPGADAVVPIEHTGAATFAAIDEHVRILQFTAPGRFIAGRGSDQRQGEIVLAAGTKLSAAPLAVAASIGAKKLPVWDRPRCAVLATGDEIISLGQSPQPAQIRNSNGPMLLALLSNLGCATHDLGTVADSPRDIAAAIRDGLSHDALFITGGMSMGQYDYVPRVLTELGATLKITKLRIKPGKPFVLATMPGGQYVFGLPGNPVSALVCTLRLAWRLLGRMAGGQPDAHIRTAPLVAPLAANGPREFYQPAIFVGDRLQPLGWKGSADIFTLAHAAALIIRPENSPALNIADPVPFILLP